jgi:nitrite reductase/ring-hydroxylating ferredoxin subunit
MPTVAQQDGIRTNSAETPSSSWARAASLEELRTHTAVMVRINGRQIALFATSDGVRACDNRCPHEGFPLAQGSLSDGCLLTCNWHNWKFNLNSGDNLYGGDQLRVYPVELRGDDIWVDLAEPPFTARHVQVLKNLHEAFDDHAYDRMAREIARLRAIGADPLDAARLAIEWSWSRLEFGWTHIYAGMADWLQLFDEYEGDEETQLVCLVEAVAHAAFDTLREPDYPYPDSVTTYSEAGFLTAVEREDEVAAIAMMRGALQAGLTFADLEEPLSRAALAHYNAFGHSLIYVIKAKALIARLGASVTAPLLLSLTRQFVFAAREDKIPEFRGYHRELARWGESAQAELPEAGAWVGIGINRALSLTREHSSARPEHLYLRLLEANARNLLMFDINHQYAVRVSVSNNVGWLDFTHGLTFANAVRTTCSRYPDLWPQGLLQLACFLGRNGGFVDKTAEYDEWTSASPESQLASLLAQVTDHGQALYIVSVHWLKLTLAVREESQEVKLELARLLFGATSRFVESPQHRRQVRRTAYQSIKFVAEG